MIIRTVCGYDFFEVSSAMQKAIRRADTGVAGFFALELWASGYRDYVWKRLFTISAEDCYGIITKEIEALWQGYMRNIRMISWMWRSARSRSRSTKCPA